MRGATRKILFSLLFLAILAGGLFFSLHALAQEPAAGTITTEDLGLEPVREGLGLPDTDIRLIAARIIRIALGLLGIIALALILYGGYTWMTAGGNEEKIQKAKKVLLNAAIGLLIILSAYAIVSFVINSLIQATTGGEGGPGGPGGPGAFSKVFYITSMPGDDLGCGIRNIHPVIVFNKPVNLETVTNNLVIRKKSDGSPANGEWNFAMPTAQNMIVFDPIGDCGIDPPQNDCLEASTTYQIDFTNPSSILSQDELPLNCNVGSYKQQCNDSPSVEFTTGSDVDTEPPTINITEPPEGKDFPEGAVVPVEMEYTDNFGLQNVSLYVNDNWINTVNISGCQTSGSVTLSWPSGTSPTGTYTLRGDASDNAFLTASTTRNIIIRPAHCYDNELNFGETEVGPPACGDGCGSCAGESCTQNSDCASGWCENGVCIAKMRIDGFSPGDGAASTTYVSIDGQYFGDDGGHVYFRKAGTGDDIWTEAYVVNCGAGIDNWTQTQLIVKVPPNAISGPVKVVTASTTGADDVERVFEDVTDGSDDWGVVKSFTVNNTLKPGLCALLPNYGPPYSYTVLLGENFGSTQDNPVSDKVYFSSSTALIKPGTWANNTIEARVPALGTGGVSVKIANEGVESNGVRFYVRELLDDDVPMIESINPESGAKGEYITITGKNFESLRGAVLFKLNSAGDAIYGSFDFPEECEGSVWSDNQIIVKFPSLGVTEGNDYSVQVQRASDSVIGPIGAEFSLESGDPAPGICKIDPPEGPIPFGPSVVMNIFGEYYERGGNPSRPYFWQTGASATTTDGRVATPDGNIIGLNDTWAQLRPPTTTETGPVVMYRAADDKMGNNMPFTVFNCVENDNTCSDPAYKCCSAGNDAGLCRPVDDLCDGETRSTNYIWRFNTGPFPPTARVVERCDAGTDAGLNLPSPSPSIRWTAGGNFDHFNVCRNALINIEFSMKMQQSTVNASTVEVYKCDPESVVADVQYQTNTCTHIAGPIPLDTPDSFTLNLASGDEFSTHDFIQATPLSGSWDDDTYYQVVLKQGIKSEPTSYEFGGEIRYLEAQDLKPNRPCGDGTAYCFIFKTDARYCKLSKVIVTPYEYWTSVLEEPMRYRSIKSNADDPGSTLYYMGSGLSDQHCIMLDPSDYEWSWSTYPTTPILYADIYGAPTGTNGNKTEVSALANTVAVGLEDDSTLIRAQANKDGIHPANEISGLVAWWQFDETSGTDAHDSSGMGNDGVGKGTLSNISFVPGKIGNALNLNNNAWLETSYNGFSSGYEPRSMCAWGRPSGIYFDWSWIYAYGSPGLPNGRAMFIGSRSTILYGGAFGSDINYNIYPGGFWKTGFWNHVCLVFTGGEDPMNRRAKLYANGILVRNYVKSDWYLVLNKAYIGTQIFNSPTGEFWRGSIDDLRVYNKALSLDEVQAIYDYGISGTPPSGESATGESPLTIDLSNPRVVDYWPNCLEACTNAEIGVKFNVIMANKNFSNAIKMDKCLDENCASKVTVTGLTKILNPADRRIIQIYFTDPSTELEPDTIYQVTMSTSSTSTADGIYQLWSGASLDDEAAFSKPMQEQFVWRFRTKKEKCTLDSVNVAPKLFTAVYVNDRQVYSAEARSAPDACDPKGQRLNPWGINWDWQSSSSSIATTTEFQTKGHSPFCESNCVKKGSDIAFGGELMPLCGNSIVEAGEDCDPPQKVGDTVTCGLNCLRPGNTSSACGDGVVDPLSGEECDTNDPATKTGCAPNCTHAGSSQATGAEEIGASICGNGTIGFGEECDLGVPADYLSPTSSFNCSENCLHIGTQAYASWCAINTSTYGGFSAQEYVANCANAISQCGDGLTSLAEDAACEAQITASSTPSPYCTENCLANSLALKKCNPTTTEYIYGPVTTTVKVVKSEGCSLSGQYEGSSLMYSEPSLCGDFVAGIGEDPACESGFVISHTLIDPWTLAEGVGLGSPAATTSPMQIANIIGTGTQTVDSYDYVKSNSGEFRILCGYETNAQCEAVAGPEYAVANNSCCYPKPSLLSRYPAPGAINVCPNTYIEAVFDRYIDPNTLSGNVMIVRGYPTACPDGEEDVSDLFGFELAVDDSDLPWYRRVWNTIARWFKKLFIREASAGVVGVYCLADDVGTPEIVSTRERGAYTTTTLVIHLTNPMATNTDYAIMLRDGMKDSLGVSVGRILDWKFVTGNEICLIDNVSVDPPEHMFTQANVSEEFFASTTASNGQAIASVNGYRWEYEWGPAESEFISILNTTSSHNIVTSKNRDGQVGLTATTKLIENTIGAPDTSYTGTSDITVFLCENPWPSMSSADFPFEDTDFDFSTYYCRDSGTVGFGDDLPNMMTTYSYGMISSQPLRRYVMTNEDNKDAIGIQIFNNTPAHLSISDWFASQGFSGNMRSMKIDGYEAITDGNNYYIDALANPGGEYWTNIYQFSINSDATSQTREVFEQMMSNLKFDLNIDNRAYCASDLDGNNVDYDLSCNTDLDCLTQIDAIKRAVPTSTANQYICVNFKDKLQRNYQRLKDLRNIVDALNYGRGIVALWPMDSINYGKINDVTGRGFEAVIKGGGSSEIISGRDAQAWHFEQSAYAEVAKPTDIGNRSFTIGQWIKTDSKQYQAWLVSNCYYGDGYRFGISMGQLTVLVGNGISSHSGVKTCSTQLVNDGNWHHIAAVYDRYQDLGSGRRIYCYIDGVLSGQVNLLSSFPGMKEDSTHLTRIGTPACATDKCMKCTTDGTSSGTPIPGCDPVFKGDVDDVRIYARALTSDEIKDWAMGSYPYKGDYPLVKENTYLAGQALSTWPTAWGQLSSEAGGTLPTDPINQMAKSGTCYKPNTYGQYSACYKDADCGTIPTSKRLSYWSADHETMDEGILQNHAVYEGTVGSSDGKGHGKAFEFYGDMSAKVVAAPNNEYYKENAGYFDGFTVSAWIYPTKKNTATIIKKGGSDEGGNSLGGFILEYSGFQWTGTQERFNNGTVRFAVFPTSTDPVGKYYFVDWQTPLALNQWHHIIARANRTSGTDYSLMLVVDNVALPTFYRANKAGGYATVSAAKIEPENNTIEIGSAFNGKIDNMSYFLPWLTNGEISQLNNALCIEHDPDTGWSSEDRRFLFVCNTSSYAYRYGYVTSTKSFELRTKFEPFTSSPPHYTWTNIINDMTKGYLDYSNGVCRSDDEIASPYTSTCGDGVVGPSEECDPPGKIQYDTDFCPTTLYKAECLSTCKWPAMWVGVSSCREATGGYCGDGKIQSLAGEVCDDGALNGTNGHCKKPSGSDPGCNGIVNTCGNNVLDEGEFCDTQPNEFDRPTCTFRPGVVIDTSSLLDPIFYFLIDLSGSMGWEFGGGDDTIRIDYVKEEIPNVVDRLSQPDSKAKIGIGTFSSGSVTKHKYDYFGVKYSNYSEAYSATHDPLFVAGGGTYTGEAVKWVVDDVLSEENLSPEDQLREKNIVLVVDGDESSASVPRLINYIPTLNSLGIKLYVIGVAYSSSNFTNWANAAGTAPYISITNSSESIATEMYDVFLSKPCREYSESNAHSCAWDCNSFGGYCGDGILDPDHEECEADMQISCTTGGGLPGYQECDRCLLGECVANVMGPGACGNEIVEETEACDRGDKNGIVCDPNPFIPPYNLTGQCTYCSYDCKNIITRDVVPCTSHAQCSGYQCPPLYFPYCLPPAGGYCACAHIP